MSVPQNLSIWRHPAFQVALRKKKRDSSDGALLTSPHPFLTEATKVKVTRYEKGLPFTPLLWTLSSQNKSLPESFPFGQLPLNRIWAFFLSYWQHPLKGHEQKRHRKQVGNPQETS